MPSLAIARSANSAALSALAHIPVAIFVGGTSGIGRATAEAFARHTKGNAHIILIGRNKAAGDAVLASFPKPPAAATHEFVACDVSRMRNIHAVTSALIARLPKVNYLVLSPGLLNFKGRDETDEGIDRRLGLHYYARWKFTYDLLPLLRKAKDAGEDARVLSVLGAGYGMEADLDDLGLKKNYSLLQAGRTSPTYTDMMMEVSLASPVATLEVRDIHRTCACSVLRGAASRHRLRARESRGRAHVPAGARIPLFEEAFQGV